MDLADVEVEMMEGERAKYFGAECEPLLNPRPYPFVGASIAASKDHTNIPSGTGTLGGYITADGTVYALTNHHVILGDARDDAFPMSTETANSIIVHQPGKGDLDTEIGNARYGIECFNDALKKADQDSEREEHAFQIKSLERRIDMLNQWGDGLLALGTCTQSSGQSIIPAPIRRTRDWAIIKVGDRHRGALDTSKFINEVSSLSIPDLNLSY